MMEKHSSTSRPEQTTLLGLLDPSRMQIFRDDNGALNINIDGEVTPSPVFLRVRPLIEPDHYIAIRDSKGNEIGLLHDWKQLDPESRDILQAELNRRYFDPVVHRILSMKNLPGVIICVFETDRGIREVMLRDFRDNIVYLGEKRLILTDAEGNRYDIPNINALDRKSYTFLSQMM